MIRTLFSRKIIKDALAALVLFAICFSTIDQSFAQVTNADCEKKREEKGNGVYHQCARQAAVSNGRCSVKDIEFAPLAKNPDINWEADNAICITWIAVNVGFYKTSRFAAAKACVAPGVEVEEAAATVSGIPFSPSTVISNTVLGAKCAAYLSAQNYTLATACCSGTAIVVASLGTAISSLAGIYGVAKTTHENAKICGSNWESWVEVADQDLDSDGEVDRYNQRGAYQGSYKKFLEDIVKGNLTYDSCVTNTQSSCSYMEGYCKKYASVSGYDANIGLISCKYYREYIYGGVEYEDEQVGRRKEQSNRGACTNPSSWDSQKRLEILGYSSDEQRYYMRGPAVASRYACDRFHDPSDPKAMAAFECCKERSQSTLCIEQPNKHKFCEHGSRCKVDGIWFDVYESKVAQNYVCAKTYSVCPYNHLLSGGTEYPDYDENGVLLNHCQYLRHCVKVPDRPYFASSSLDGAYFSQACRDIKGDAQNSTSYEYPLVSLRNFAAPMSQCFKETMENVFLNKAGSTKCLEENETPDEEGVCVSGYQYKKGDRVNNTSFFENIQTYLRSSIKIALSLVITIMGGMILLGGKMMEKKDILHFIVKLSIVTYFALGDAWQAKFFDGVYGISADISNLVMKVNEDKPDYKLDGCQFPKYHHALDRNKEAYENPKDDPYFRNPLYPKGLSYLRMWDTFDCKIAFTLGFGPEATVPKLFFMILAGFLSGPLGIIFMIATMLLAFYILALTIRGLHIFILSSTAIILLIFVSPIMVTLSLFKKTEDMFKKWMKNLGGFILQPVILFAYLGIVVTVFDSVLIGDAAFIGDGLDNPKSIVCSEEVADSSVYCIFANAEIKTNDSLAKIGIGLPYLSSMSPEKITTVATAALLLFFLTQFLDSISAFAMQLVGGATLSSTTAGVAKMAGATFGGLRAIQERGMGFGAKHVASRITPNALRKGAAKAAQSAGRTAKNIGGLAQSVRHGFKNKSGEAAGNNRQGANPRSEVVGQNNKASPPNAAGNKPAAPPPKPNNPDIG
ncbi:MAG: type IV secretion system protein [Proteobacteria bacterium]|nr:type IV secretion system protein [Pseudomonadota bacterium]